MYELLILAQLMCAPEHGYQIAKIASDMLGPGVKISLGTLYPLLTKLEQSGFIKKLDEGDEGQEATMRQRGRQQTRTTYEITPAGRMRFHQLMIDTISNPGDYQRLFRLKVLYLDFLQPDERLHLLNHYITYCETLVLYLNSERRDLLQVTSDPAQMHILRQQVDLEAQAREMYELDHAKDQIMTLLKVVLANLGMWVRDQYFSESYQHGGWQRLLPFFKLGGGVTTTASEVQLEVCAFNNRTLARDVEEVCRNVNTRGASLPDGRRLVMVVGERLRAHPLNAPLAHTG